MSLFANCIYLCICVCCVLSLCIYASHSRAHLPFLPPLPPSSSTTASFMDQLKSGVSKALPVLVGGSAFIAPSISNALTKEDLSSLSYLQVCPLSLPPFLPPFVSLSLFLQPADSLLCAGSRLPALYRHSHRSNLHNRLIHQLTPSLPPSLPPSLHSTTGEGHGLG